MLEDILEANLKLFGKATAKKLLLVLRDWNDDEDLKSCKQKINDEVNKIWNNMEEYKNLELTKFF